VFLHPEIRPDVTACGVVAMENEVPHVEKKHWTRQELGKLGSDLMLVRADSAGPDVCQPFA